MAPKERNGKYKKKIEEN